MFINSNNVDGKKEWISGRDLSCLNCLDSHLAHVYIPSLSGIEAPGAGGPGRSQNQLPRNDICQDGPQERF